ncbi:MAG: inositol monophosphatase family protein [Planctomycetales bacterium]
MHLPDLIAALIDKAPAGVRWCGAIAKRLRQFNIALDGKHSGSSMTDALTLADLSVQELLVAYLRDADPIFRECKILAEETTGDLTRFATEGPYTLAIDPIDGTKQYRDRTGNGYSIILTLQSFETVHYSLVFIPEEGEFGTWVQASGDSIVCGPDDPSRPARDVLRSLPGYTRENRPASKNIYLIGFQKRDEECAKMVTGLGLRGYHQDEMPGCLYSLLARGDFAGSLIHSPNIYDFPAGMHLARILGGDAIWVHNRQPVRFEGLWMDERANMLRLPGIVACSPNRQILDQLATLARDWNPVRYAD